MVLVLQLKCFKGVSRPSGSRQRSLASTELKDLLQFTMTYGDDNILDTCKVKVEYRENVSWSICC